MSDAARAPRLRGISLADACRMTLDELIIRIKFLIKMHKRLNLKAPSTFNEKLQ